MAKRGSDDTHGFFPTTDPSAGEPGADRVAPGGGFGTDMASPRWASTLDRVLSVQRPVVVGHVNAIRRRHPDATPDDVIRTLERQYLVAVSTAGAAVGASAVIPGVGFAASLGLTGAETVGFLEASALFAQSVTEVHGIAVTDPERARTLVMAMILGAPGTSLVKQLAAQAGGGPGRSAFWGEMVTSSLPKSAVSSIGKRLRDTFVKRFAARQGASVIGRAVPFGIGAVIGGVGNHALARKIIDGSRSAFGPAPAYFPVPLDLSAPTDGDNGTAQRGGMLRALPWRRQKDRPQG